MSACTRDLWKIKDMDFPVFGIGCHPADSKGRIDVIAVGAPIRLERVSVKTGDYVLGDEDGIVIIPRGKVMEAVRLACIKVAKEDTFRQDLEKGIPMGEAFKKHGIL